MVETAGSNAVGSRFKPKPVMPKTPSIKLASIAFLLGAHHQRNSAEKLVADLGNRSKDPGDVQELRFKTGFH